jgi:hypothetical protein
MLLIMCFVDSLDRAIPCAWKTPSLSLLCLMVHPVTFNCSQPLTKVPVLGGKEIDLFLLYTEVIRIGGVEKVSIRPVEAHQPISAIWCARMHYLLYQTGANYTLHTLTRCFQVVLQKRWREVIDKFDFPPSCTNAGMCVHKALYSNHDP